MVKQPVIETERLILRPLTSADAPAIQAMASEFAIADTCQIPHPYPENEAAEWIATCESAFARHAELALAVERRSDQLVVGTVSLMAIFEGHQAELGFWIGRDFWGNGYASEAAAALIHWAFRSFDLIRVHACHLSRNSASARVLNKIGMIHEGTSPKHLIKWGKPEDIEFWGILRDE